MRKERHGDVRCMREVVGEDVLCYVHFVICYSIPLATDATITYNHTYVCAVFSPRSSLLVGLSLLTILFFICGYFCDVVRGSSIYSAYASLFKCDRMGHQTSQDLLDKSVPSIDNSRNEFIIRSELVVLHSN